MKKLFILSYLGLTLALAVIFSAGASFSYAANIEQMAFSSVEPVTSAILIRDAANELIVSYSQVIGIAIEPFFAVLTNATIGFINALLGLPLDIYTTPLSYPIVLFCFCVFVFGGKIFLSLPSTQTFTMVTYGELEKLIGYLSIFVIGIFGVINMTKFCASQSNTIYQLLGREQGGVFFAFSVTMSFTAACISLVLFYVVKTVILCAEVIQMPYAFLPGVSFLFECAKSFVVLILCTMNLIFPIAGFLLNLMTVGLGIYLFLKCYYVIDFYKSIYLIPTYHSLGLGSVTKNAVNEKTPQWIYESMKDRNETFNMAFPTYLIRTYSKENKLKQYEKWWFICTKDKQYLFRDKESVKDMNIFDLSNCDMLYYKESFRYLEFFTLDGPESNLNMIFKKPQKDLHFVISHDFKNFFSNIIREVEYRDYLALKEQIKASVEERRRNASSEIASEILSSDSTLNDKSFDDNITAESFNRNNKTNKKIMDEEAV